MPIEITKEELLKHFDDATLDEILDEVPELTKADFLAEIGSIYDQSMPLQAEGVLKTSLGLLNWLTTMLTRWLHEEKNIEHKRAEAIAHRIDIVFHPEMKRKIDSGEYKSVPKDAMPLKRVGLRN